MTARTWRDAYLIEVDRQVADLLDSKRRGQTWRVVDGRTVDPTRMTDAQIRELARRQAERITNYAINVELEAARKAGRVADVA